MHKKQDLTNLFIIKVCGDNNLTTMNVRLILIMTGQSSPTDESLNPYTTSGSNMTKNKGSKQQSEGKNVIQVQGNKNVSSIGSGNTTQVYVVFLTLTAASIFLWLGFGKYINVKSPVEPQKVEHVGK